MVFKRQTNRDRRRGVILLVVLALLTLFAVVGISFVLYADAEATAARISKEAETEFHPNIDPELVMSMFLGQLIYDVPDDSYGIYSGLRGQSLARNMYGWNPGGLNDKPYTGTGKLHYTPTTPIPGATSYATDDSYLVNFTYFSADGFLRDPERYGSRPSLGAKGPGPYVGGFNVPYTYPDHQNYYLAMMQSLLGTVLAPSFHRPWLFGPLADPANPVNPQNNPNWTNTAGKYLTLRPRPIDMQVSGMPMLFPYPIDSGGDVRNLDWTTSGQDSIWIDINAPVMIAPNGQKYKMLVAPLILELDSRINLNVAGNILLGPGGYNGHTSHEGWGAFEMNISKVLNSSAAPQEWTKLFLGTTNSQPGVASPANTYGRYGSGRYPTGPALTAGTAPRQYAPVDFNGVVDPSPNSATTYFQLPWSTPLATTPPTQPYQIFPSFPSGQYGNGVPVETTDATGKPNHPLMYNALRPALDNRLLPPSSLAALLRFGSTNSEAMTSDLLRLCPQNFILDGTPAIGGGNATPLKRRNMVTLLSNDLDRPGATPYIWDPTDATTGYGKQFNATGNNTTGLWAPLFPLPNPIAFPNPANSLPTPPNGTLDTSEFDPSTWRSTLGQQLRVNLNRPLTSYPTPYQAPFTISATSARFTLTGTAASNVPYDTSIAQAVADRQQLALDIFTALRKAVGALPLPPNPNAPAPGTADYNALRWLAQLAVNIVDFIDQDDISTPFRWDPSNANPGDFGYVFGTELPRLVINEALIQIDNDPTDKNLVANNKATTSYNVNTWVELCNPFINEGANAPDSANQAVLQDATGSIYQLVITDPAQPNTQPISGSRLLNMRHPANVAGDPSYPTLGPNYGVAAGKNVMTYGSAPAVPCVVNNSTPANTWGANTVVMPLNNAYSDPTSTNKGFYVIGPPAANSVTATNLPTTTTSPAMTYQAALESATPAGAFPMPTILLQRLACPGLPFQGDPTKSNYNPYITVDYYEAFQSGGVIDSRQYNAAGPTPAGTQAGLPNWAATDPPTSGIPSASWGRNQPYAATNGLPGGGGAPPVQGQWNAQLADPNPANPPPANQPINTFFRHNAREVNAPPNGAAPAQTLKVPFDWLVHLDRQLISPMELLHVSAFKPHELTQQFYDATTGNSFTHFVPWTNQQSRLYRVFELIETASWAAGVRPGGRIPGKININMLNDQEIFEAICDAQTAGNWFNQAEVDKVLLGQTGLLGLIAQRTPSGVPGPNDQPFWSMATGVASGGDPLDPNAIVTPGTPTPRGILNTLLRSNSANSALALDPFQGKNPSTDNPALQNVPNHSYVRNQMLTKIFNNLTTRSNVFAVWMTVGFFEVAKDTSGNYVGDQFLPVKLGAEIGSAEGRQIRHRAFAIVDRTNLQVFSTTCSTAITAATAPYQPQTVTLGTIVPASLNGTVPSLQAGMVLVFDPNTDNEETVVVQGVPGPGQISAVFQRPHAAWVTGVPPNVIQRGNPGPWMLSQPGMLRYNPRQDTLVVPYFALID